MSERFIVDDAGTLIDLVSRDTYDIVEEVCPVLNKIWTQTNRFAKHNSELEKENEQLKEKINCLLDDLQSNNEVNKEIVEDYRRENERLKQDKKRLIGFLHRYKGVDVEDVDEEVLSKEYLDEWGELYSEFKGDVE